MSKPTTPVPEVIEIRSSLLSSIRQRIRSVIEDVAEEELKVALGADTYERCASRRGYRNGEQARYVVTEYGPAELRVPRARLFTDDGGTEEWRSSVVPRYQRRTRKVDEAILGTYLAGANSRRIRQALKPLLGDLALSKSAISRVVSRLRERFAAWRQRDLSDESYVYLFLDAMFLPVRVARRVVKVPVQAAVGVDEDGHKVLLSLEIAGSESTASWKTIVEGLRNRGLRSPVLVVLDGNPGLCRAVRDTWPATKLQRCTRHKLENLLAKAPKHSHAELKRDYRAITHAESAAMAKSAYQAFVRKWGKLSSEVVKSLDEAGPELLTFVQLPKSQWKTLRTTNMIERVNEEFRRRTKTQGAFCNERAALVVLYGLFAMGQIQLRRIDGYEDMTKVARSNLQAAA